MPTKTDCSHVTATAAAPTSDTCEECGSGVALRMCTECGHVGCCESQLAHNTAHFRASGHPVIRSLPLSDSSFTWCYTCGAYV
ncbi:MAG TPA: UBP-type zinc finger domain-containing protein [Actinomycetota bacterium]|nr:UBP-type zinc finger domain-containing protein [Actinomycetota bacterium]